MAYHEGRNHKREYFIYNELKLPYYDDLYNENQRPWQLPKECRT
jgi:hypothetical protein